MVRLNIRPRPGCDTSRDLSFESVGSEPTNKSKSTLDTSSLTSCDTFKWHFPNLSVEDEVVLLRHRVKAYVKREGKLKNDLVQIQEKLQSSKKNTNRWIEAVQGDVRPGSYYRKEILLLRQKMDQMHDDIRDREITIENLMAGNHPNHSFHVEYPVGQQTSVCSSLMDEALEGPHAQEMERLLSENSSYAYQLRKQEKEVTRLRRKLAEWEKQIDTKEQVVSNEKKGLRTMGDGAVPPSKNISISSCQSETSSIDITNIQQNFNQKKFANSFSSVPFNPFQLAEGQPFMTCNSEPAIDSYEPGGSIRKTKRVMELQNELNKITKERNSLRHDLEQNQIETEKLRTALCDTRVQLRKNEGDNIDLPVKQREIMDLKNALDESLVELESAATIMTEQKIKLEDMKKDLSGRKDKCTRLDHSLQDKTERLEIAERALIEKDAKIEEQMNQLQKADKILLEKELEKSRLKTSMKELQSKLDIMESDRGAVEVEIKQQNIVARGHLSPHTMDIHQATRPAADVLESFNLEPLKGANEELADSLMSGRAESNVMKDSALGYQSQIDAITAQAKEQQYEMDILVKHFAQLGESNTALEQKCKVLEKGFKFLTEELLQLHDVLVSRNCEIEPLKKYIQILMDTQVLENSTPINRESTIDELGRARLELVNKLQDLVEGCKSNYTKRSSLQEDPKENDLELSKLLEIKKENQALTITVLSSKELLRAEREEKDDICRQRDILVTDLKSRKDELKKVKETNKCLEKTIRAQSISLKTLSDENEGKDDKIAELKKRAIANKNLLFEHSELKRKDLYNVKRVDELLSNLLRANETLRSLKAKLDESNNSKHETEKSYGHQIATLTMAKDVTINTLRKELTALQSESAEEIARLTDELSKMQGANIAVEKQHSVETIRMKDQRIYALEQTLHAQEQTVDSLQFELRNMQLNFQNLFEQRGKDVEELEGESHKVNSMKQISL